MDPWWNPAVERQAQDRIHRIGQYKPIRCCFSLSNPISRVLLIFTFCLRILNWSDIYRILRFVIENTVEERILKLQEKKELVFEGLV